MDKISKLQKKYPWMKFYSTWGKSGKAHKRRLHKARRRYIKSVLRCGRGKEPVGIESEVNNKGW